MTERGEALNVSGRIMWFDDFNGVGEETNDYRFLSNFHVGEPIMMPDGFVFATGEHAFAAYKAADQRAFLAIAGSQTPGQAKAMGRQCTLRDDWEEIKLDVMAAVIRAKFTLDRAEGIWLLETGDALLIEGTYWQDRVWGVDLHVAADRRDPMQAPGRNWLGTLLMARRAELRAHKQMGWSHNTGAHNADFFA